MKRTKLLALISASVVLLTVAAACGNKQAAAQATKHQTLKVVVAAEVPTIDSAKSYDVVSDDQIYNFQQGLYQLGNKNKVIPAIATKLPTISHDGLTYTIHLCHNAKWSNGTPVTAADFVYAWQRVVNPKTASQSASKFFDIANAKDISLGKKPVRELGVAAHGKYELTVKLATANPYFLNSLTETNFFPQNKAFVEKAGKKYGSSAKYVLANGPFELKDWTSTSLKWHYVKNPDYYGAKKVHLARINESVVKSTSSATDLYNSKAADVIPLSGDFVKQYQNKPGYKKISTYGVSNIEIDLTNEQHPELANRNFRKALFYAVNRQQFTQDILQDGSTPNTGYLARGNAVNPKTGKDINDELGKETYYDRTKARHYLKLAQDQLHQKTFTLKLQSADTDTGKRVTEYLQSTLAKNLPGVKIETQNIPAKNLFASLMSYNFQLTTGGWEAEADPAVVLEQFTTGYAHDHGGYSNPTYDRLIKDAEGKDAANAPKRYQDLKQAQQILLNDAVVIPLYHSANSYLINPQVKGIQTHSFGQTLDFTNAYFKK